MPQPDPAETSESIEEPTVKPEADGGAPAPSDGSTGGTTTGDELTAPRGTRPARPSQGDRRLAGPPSDPGNDRTG